METLPCAQPTGCYRQGDRLPACKRGGIGNNDAEIGSQNGLWNRRIRVVWGDVKRVKLPKGIGRLTIGCDETALSDDGKADRFPFMFGNQTEHATEAGVKVQEAFADRQVMFFAFKLYDFAVPKV